MKRLAIIFGVFVFIALLMTAFSTRDAGISEAVAGKNCGVQHTDETGHDGSVQKSGGPGEKKAGTADTHGAHDGHDHGTKADEVKKCPAETEKKHDHDLQKPDAHKHADHDEHKDAGKHDDHTGHRHDGHDHGADASDLDRPVDEMWSAKCEHEILHYTCDECRYELGVVKLSDTVFKSKDSPGLVSVIPVGRQDFSKPLQLTGEVVMNDSRTVRLKPAAGNGRALCRRYRPDR